jgi:hypothetical protein
MFDADHERQLLLGPVGFDWRLGLDQAEARSERSMGNHASSFVRMAVQCLVVGFDDPAYQLLQKAKSWLETAIAENEIPRSYFQYGTEASRFRDLALCKWFLDGTHDSASLSRAVSLREQYFETRGADKVEVGMVLPIYVEAGDNDLGMRRFESTRGMSPPKSLRNVSGEGRMAYVLCRQHLDGDYVQSDIDEALQRVFRRHMDEWLNHGQATTAARWMKIAHWDRTHSTESAKAALLHCYDYVCVPDRKE